MARHKKTELDSRDKEVVRLKILDNRTRDEISKTIDITPLTVTRITESPEGKKYAAELEAKREKTHMDAYNDVVDDMMKSVRDIAKELKRIALEGKGDAVRARACQSFMYMAGFKPKELEDMTKTPKLVIEEREEEGQQQRSA
jgi:hypothetical protein